MYEDQERSACILFSTSGLPVFAIVNGGIREAAKQLTRELIFIPVLNASSSYSNLAN